MKPAVAAMVLASHGGARLERALASVAWADERLVIDPAGRLTEEALPPGVRRARAAADADAPWLLLLEEHEVVSPALAASVRAVATDDAPSAYRIPREAHVFDARFHLRGAPIRLARAGARVRLRRDLALELRPAAGRAGRLRTPVIARGAESFARAVDELDADATTLAALLQAARVRPTLWRLATAPTLAGARALGARGPVRRFRRRWTLAVFAAYRVMVAYAKLWEMDRAEGSRTR